MIISVHKKTTYAEMNQHRRFKVIKFSHYNYVDFNLGRENCFLCFTNGSFP